MKFKTPKMQNITDNALKLGSGVAGAMASNIVVSKLTETKVTASDQTSDEAKKDANKKKMIKGAVAAASLIGVACVDGNDTSASLVRSALIGSGIMQSISLAKEFVKDADHKKFGLACPCSGETYLAQPKWFEDYSYQPTGGFSYVSDYSYDEQQPQTTNEATRNPLVNFVI